MVSKEKPNEFSVPPMRDASTEEGMSPAALWVSALILNGVVMTARRIDIIVRKMIKNSNERQTKIVAEIKRRGL